MTQALLSIAETLPIGALRDGVVLDHITAGMSVRVLKLLNLSEHRLSMAVGIRLPSASMGVKDVIKVEGWTVPDGASGKIAIFAPSTTICRVVKGEVVSKEPVALPPEIEGVLACPNRSCITHAERRLGHFFVMKHSRHVRLRCRFCEKVFSQDEVAQHRCQVEGCS